MAAIDEAMRDAFNRFARPFVFANYVVNDFGAWAETRLRGTPAAVLDTQYTRFINERNRLVQTIKAEDTDSAFYFALNIMRTNHDEKAAKPKNWRQFVENAFTSYARTLLQYPVEDKNRASLKRIGEALNRFRTVYHETNAPVHKFLNQVTHNEILWQHPENLVSSRYYHNGSAMDRWVKYLNGKEPKKPELSF